MKRTIIYHIFIGLAVIAALPGCSNGGRETRKLNNGRVQTFHDTTNSTIPAGTGFWYLNGGAAKTIEW